MIQSLAMVIDLTTCLGCQACSAACAIENQTPYWEGKFRTHVEEADLGTFPDVARVFFPRLCMQCDDAPCVKVCPTGATYKAADGVVMVDADKCMGCKACVEACPYGARYVYTREDVKTAKAVFMADPRHTVAHVDKCDFCSARRSEGLDPACVATCPGEARRFGDLNDPNSPVSQLLKSGKAKPLAPEYGTQPRVFYIR